MFNKLNAYFAYLRLKIEKILTPERALAVSFGGVILGGSVLLMLPQATVDEPLGFIDALFTATSATCVTGLIVVDTGSRFTLFGQGVILILIQAGGLGIMTFSTAFLYLLDGRFSIGSRDVLQETLSQMPIHNLRSLVKTVFLGTVLIESAGAALLTLRFAFDMPFSEALYSGIFHSISAFCNAGFSLYADSFTRYRGDFMVNLVLMGLIFLGGIGFIVIYELSRVQKFQFKWADLSLHSRLVIATSALLIIVGMVLILFLEWNVSLKQQPVHTKILTSLFQSITARTAGFNTINLIAASDAALFLIIMLMFIGASSGSCGGGIKTTTFAVIAAHIRARFQNQDETNIFSLRIPIKSVSKAITVVFFSALAIVLFTMLLSISELPSQSHPESSGKFIELLFEVVSAFATVGLSTGMTSELSPVGRIFIILLMFMGRLGPLTLAMAVGKKEPAGYKFVQEDVLIG